MTESTIGQSFNDYQAAYEKHRAASKKTNLANKSAIFDALLGSAIRLVIVAFDGEGDSGQIESLTAYEYGKADPVPLPKLPISYAQRSFRNRRSSVSKKHLPLDEAIETFCYALLEQECSGWEIDEGAFGTFTFTGPGRAVSLEFNARFTTSKLTTRDF